MSVGWSGCTPGQQQRRGSSHLGPGGGAGEGGAAVGGLGGRLGAGGARGPQQPPCGARRAGGRAVGCGTAGAAGGPGRLRGAGAGAQAWNTPLLGRGSCLGCCCGSAGAVGAAGGAAGRGPSPPAAAPPPASRKRRAPPPPSPCTAGHTRPLASSRQAIRRAARLISAGVQGVVVQRVCGQAVVPVGSAGMRGTSTVGPSWPPAQPPAAHAVQEGAAGLCPPSAKPAPPYSCCPSIHHSPARVGSPCAAASPPSFSLPRQHPPSSAAQPLHLPAPQHARQPCRCGAPPPAAAVTPPRPPAAADTVLPTAPAALVQAVRQGQGPRVSGCGDG